MAKNVQFLLTPWKFLTVKAERDTPGDISFLIILGQRAWEKGTTGAGKN